MESGWLDFKTGNKVKTSSEYVAEIQTLRAKVEVLDGALEYLKEHRLWVNSHAKAIIESALATYDKLSEVKHDTNK